MTDFDQAVSLTGYGKFHYTILLVSALSIMSVGFQNGLSAYIFPAAQCELHLASSQLGFLNVAFLAGGTLSSFLWGILADSCGRRNILVAAHLANATITIICVCNTFTISLVVCRFLNGFLTGAPGSIIFSYLGEFQPSTHRSSVICYSGLFFTLSWLLLPLLSAIILPLNVSWTWNSYLILTPWRIFLIILTVPEIIAALWFMKLPESPKFYMANHNSREALVVLKRMFASNTGKVPDEFPVKNLVISDKNTNYNSNGEVGQRRKIARLLDEVSEQFQKLFHSPLLFVSLLTSTIMFTNMFGIFGLGLWLPELFVKLQQFQRLHPNATVSIKQLALISHHATNQTCQPSFDASVIESTVAMGVSSLLGNVLSGWFASRVSLPTIPCVTMLSGGLAAVAIYWLRTPMQNLVVAALFQASMMTANMTLGSVTVELFPTKVGAMAVCTVMFAGRIGAIASNMMFAFLIDKHCEVAIFLVGVTILIGAVLCLMIPKRILSDDDNYCSDSYVNGKHIAVSVISSFDTKL